MAGPATNSADLLARLAQSPDVYPQGMDLIHQALLLIKFDADSYRAASFLDDRILTPNVRGVWVRFDRVSGAAPAVQNAQPLHFIFHTGHVGSTLVSRLLDESGLVLPLREPLPLRILANAHDSLGQPDSLVSETQFDALLALLDRLWGRGYPWSRAVVLKATSSAGRLAGPLLSRRPAARAICLNLKPEPFLAALLAGQNSPADMRGHGAERVRRLMRLVAIERPKPLHALSLGELAAMSWLTETATQHEAMAQFGERILRLDFDDVLADVPASIGRVASHFGLSVDQRFLAGLAQSEALTRYAKAPEHAYTPLVRTQLLNDSRRVNAGEIAKGLAWLDDIARASAKAAAVLQSYH